MTGKKPYFLEWIVIAVIWCAAALFCVCSRFVSAADGGQFFGDGEGWLYACSQEDGQLVITVWDPAGKTSSIRNSSAVYTSFGQSGSLLYALGRQGDDVLLLTVQSGEENLLVLSGAGCEGTSAARDGEGNWLLPVSSGGKEIRVFSPEGEWMDRIRFSQPVRQLLTLPDGPAAVTDDGLYSIPTEECLWKGTLSGPVCVNGKTISSSRTLLRKTGSRWETVSDGDGEWPCAAANGERYVCREDRVVLLSEDGEPLKEYVPEMTPDRLLISGNTAAAVHRETLTILRPSLFSACSSESVSSRETASPAASSRPAKESSSSRKESSQKESSRKESSRKESSRKESSRRTSSARAESSGSKRSSSMAASSEASSSSSAAKIPYRLNEDWKLIENIPQGTTAARFRKQLAEEGITCTFRNHHGDPVTQGRLGTGWAVTLTTDEGNETYQIVIPGDLTGEGNVNSSDDKLLLRYLEGTAGLTPAQYFAAAAA